jgi:hypothetical protein
MATPTREEIAKMREELRKDLEALDRVERLFAERNGSHSASPRLPAIPPPPSHGLPPPPVTQETGLGLKQLCIEGLKKAGVIGAAPKDLLQYCKQRGYRFTSDQNGSASITTALSRLVAEGDVFRNEGRYCWIAE